MPLLVSCACTFSKVSPPDSAHFAVLKAISDRFFSVAPGAMALDALASAAMQSPVVAGF